MGTIVYGTRQTELSFDDRTLAHLQVVFSVKLRRRESFLFSWRGRTGNRNAIWIDPSIPFYFLYEGSRQPALNPRWLEEMSIAAGSVQGLVLGIEPVYDRASAADDAVL